MSRYILLFLILATGVSAADYNILVTNDDHVDILTRVLDGLNYFFGIDNSVNEGAVRYKSIVVVAILLGTLWSLIQMAMLIVGGNPTEGIKRYVINLMMIFTVALIIYGPRSSVLIQTPSGTQYAINEDVPFLVAFSLSIFTSLQFELSDISSSAFNIPDPTDNFKSGGAGGLGFGGAVSAISRIGITARLKDNNITELPVMYATFMRDCVILPMNASADGSGALTGMLNGTNIKGNMAPTVTGYSNELVTYNGGTGTCLEFWSAGSSESIFGPSFTPLQTAINTFENGIDPSSKLGELGGAIAYLGALINNTSAISNAAEVKEQITQAVLSNEFRAVYAKMGIAGQVASDGAAQAMAETQLSGISTGLYIAENIPRIAFILFVLMISAIPFLLAFAMFPGSGGTLINFLKTLLWMSLWEPMSNILGIFQDFHFATILTRNGYTTQNDIVSMSASNIIDISSEAAILAGIAGGLFVIIQGLSWMLITGSGQMIGNIASAVAAGFQKYGNADAQLETRSDMQEATLMSAQMGKEVSMREKYAYSANLKAGLNAGTTTGFMKTHGSEVGAFKSVARATEMQTAINQTQAITTANVYGDTATMEKTITNKALQETNEVKSEFEDITNKTAINQGKTKGKQKSSDTAGNVESYSSPEDAYNVQKTISSHKENIKIGSAENLDDMSDKKRESTEQYFAVQNTKTVGDLIEKTKKQKNISFEQATDLISETASTMGAEKTVSGAAKIIAQGDSNSFIEQMERLSKVKGYSDRETSEIHKLQGDERNQQQQKFEAEEKTKSLYVKMDTVNKLQEETIKKADKLQGEVDKDKATLEALPTLDKNRYTNENVKKLQEIKQKAAGRADAKESYEKDKEKFIKSSRENRKNYTGQQLADANIKTLKEFKKAGEDYKNSMEENKVERFVPSNAMQEDKDATQKRTKLEDKITNNEVEVTNLRATAISIEPQNRGKVDGNKHIEDTSRAANSETESYLMKGTMDGVELDSFMETVGEVANAKALAEFQGSLNAIERLGEKVGQGVKDEAVLSTLTSDEKAFLAKEFNIDPKDTIKMSMAAQKTNTLAKMTNRGKGNLTIAVSMTDGSITASDNRRDHIDNIGSSTKGELVETAIKKTVGADYNSDIEKVVATKVGSNTVSFGINTLTSFATKKFVYPTNNYTKGGNKLSKTGTVIRATGER